MPNLREVQRRLAAEILEAATGRRADAGTFAEALRLPPGIVADERLAVYRDGYPARILEALGDAFPAIANICGEGSFAVLVARYIRDRRVHALSLNDVGRFFPDHCRSDELAAQLPFLGDLADLERAMLLALHSADRPPVDPSVFTAWDMDDWERVVLEFQPSTAVIQSSWPLYDLWMSRETPRDEIDIDLADRPQSVLSYRHGYEVACRVVDRPEAIALTAMTAGETLGDAIEQLAEATTSETDTGELFARWLSSGLITSARLA